MAEEEEATEEETPQEDAPEGGGKSKKKLLIILAALIFVLIGIGAPVAYILLSGEEEEELKQAQQVEEGEPEPIVIEGFEEEDEYDELEDPLGGIFPLETFVVNLTEGGYLRAQVQLEFMGPDVPNRFRAREVLVRDALIGLLSSRTKKELEGPKAKGDLKDDIEDSVNEILKKEEVKNVYFTQFVVQ